MIQYLINQAHTGVNLLCKLIDKFEDNWLLSQSYEKIFLNKVKAIGFVKSKNTKIAKNIHRDIVNKENDNTRRSVVIKWIWEYKHDGKTLPEKISKLEF